MTVKDWLESTFDPNDPYQVRERVTCVDGYSVSIQGGTRTHYCSPRQHVNRYDEVELGYPSSADDELIPYAEDPNDLTGSVFGYVPIAVVEAVITKHGGIVTEPTPPTNPATL
ncbi:hypothetical protein [Cohnella sp. JJ-181]|uniref:hypothetical protein n=1 Tax=Cohnella rhizoplanae TaxID=2974897 RepID=UPI00232B4F5E|nr:hypothetical protein [Cohnella sp. JJ-181]